MADYSGIKPYLEKIISSVLPYSEKPVKTVVRHFPSDMPTEDISSGFENVRLYVINARK
jgi:hypothetical protein